MHGQSSITYVQYMHILLCKHVNACVKTCQCSHAFALMPAHTTMHIRFNASLLLCIHTYAFMHAHTTMHSDQCIFTCASMPLCIRINACTYYYAYACVRMTNAPLPLLSCLCVYVSMHPYTTVQTRLFMCVYASMLLCILFNACTHYYAYA